MFFWPTSHLLTRTSLLHMSKLWQSRFSQFVHHGGHYYLILNNLISNLIALIMSTHPSQHPHFHNMNLLNIGVFNWSTLCLIQQCWSNHHSIEFTFKFWWFLLPHNTPKVSRHSIHAAPIWRVILLLMSPLPYITEPRSSFEKHELATPTHKLWQI